MDSLRDLDQFLFLGINSFHASWLNSFMAFASGQIIWIPLVSFIIWKCRNSLHSKMFYLFLGFAVMAILTSDVTSSYIVKNLSARLRPCRLPDIKLLINQFGQKCGGKYGFVSSHAANSMALVSFAFLSLKLEFKKFGWIWFLPLLVGWSRIYVGVHYPGDILGGYFVGACFGYLFYFFFKNISTEPVSEFSIQSHF